MHFYMQNDWSKPTLYILTNGFQKVRIIYPIIDYFTISFKYIFFILSLSFYILILRHFFNYKSFFFFLTWYFFFE
jgi:hypothetical protein